MKNKRKGFLIAFLTIFFFILAITGIILIVEDSGVVGNYVTNITKDSATFIVIKKNPILLPVSKSVLYLDDIKLEICDEKTQEICIAETKSTQQYSLFKVDNLNADTGYSLKWANTLVGKLSNKKEVNVNFGTVSVDDNIPQIKRIYGKVVNTSDNGVSGALVIVKNSEDSSINPLSVITSEDGTYNIVYSNNSNDKYLQNFKVYTSDGDSSEYDTASFYNQPVADIVVGKVEKGSEDVLSLLSSKVEAANSCITDTQMGGIRAQCNANSDWTPYLDTATCPNETTKVKLGVVKVTDSTKFHNPDGIKLKLFDSASGKYVVDSSGSEVIVNNGAYVELAHLQKGKTYQIKAFEGTTECVNSSETNPTLTFNEPANKKPTQTVHTGESTQIGNIIYRSTRSADLCKKMGEDFAIQYEVPVDKMQTAVNLRMRWGEAIITDLSMMNAYRNSVANGKSTGINMILRLCYKNNCNIENDSAQNGTAYGNKIVEIYNELKNSGNLPENGLFIHVGHNEPNNAEYRDPATEAKFMADTLAVLEGAGLLSSNADDIKIKAISSNLDLYLEADGQWAGCTVGSEGCDDPNPHPNYRADSYVKLMLQNPEFKSKSKLLYAWAVNDYLLGRGNSNVTSDVEKYVEFLGTQGLSKNVGVTELGRINTSIPWDALAETIRGLDKNENVVFVLLFDSLGANRDGAFAYHSELWNNQNLLAGLISSCGTGNFNIPQEGTSPVSVTPSSGGKVLAKNVSVGVSGFSSNPIGTSQYGSSFNGKDPCKDGLCVGPDYLKNTTASSGLINGDFETSFISDGAAELKVPQFWHIWYQDGCQTNKCGYYECKEDGAICRRPEYGEGGGEFAERVMPGTGAKSVKWFTTFGTHYAGLFQHIDLKQGGKNEIKFKAFGSSWSQANTPEEQVVNKFIGKIGIDPSGGINPNSGSVVWTDWKELPNVGPNGASAFTEFEISLSTSSSIITVFIAANNEYPYKNSDAYWDNAQLFVNGELAVGDPGDSVSNGYGEVGEECDSSNKGGVGGDACWDTSIKGFESAMNSNILSMGGSNVLGATTIRLPGRGEYEFDSDVFEFTNSKVYNYSREGVAVPIFQDANGDGIHNENEYYVPNVLDINMTKVGDLLEYELKPGMMMISIPFYSQELNKASKILQEIANQGGSAIALATYSNVAGNVGWKSITMRGSQVYGDDFELKPSDALYLIINKESKFIAQGDSYAEPVKEYVKFGWNLVAIKGEAKDVKASKVIEEINKLPGVVATKVTIWDSKRGRFNSFVKEGNSVYGEDFIINETMGVFVFIKDGIGYWTPS